MNFEEFKEQVKTEVSSRLKSEVFLEKIPKNNGIILSGLIITSSNSNVSPTIYLDTYFENYQNGEGIESIVNDICKMACDNELNQPIDMSDFLNYEIAGKQIVFRLVNFEKNRERLKEIPHRRFLDLAVVYYYLVLEEPFNGKAAIQINNKHMGKWGISEKELYKTALHNTPALLPCDIKNINSHMINMLEKSIIGGYDGDDEILRLSLQYFLSEIKSNSYNKDPMYVMTNKDILMGAACMLYPNTVKRFASHINSDLYILPSSVHETIIVPAGENISRENLKRMVSEINMEQVEEGERLSDNVYIYKRAIDTIVMA